MADLAAFLAEHTLVGIDTSPFIYHLEFVPQYADVTQTLFEWLDAGGTACTSTLTLTEILVHYYRHDDIDGARQVTTVLTTFPRLTLVPVDLEVADLAARFRAAYGLRTADAIQAASAHAAGATALITNDRTLSRITEIAVFVLDDALPPS